MSIRRISHSSKAGNVSRSRTQLVVNCRLPAPIKANFFIAVASFFSIILPAGESKIGNPAVFMDFSAIDKFYLLVIS